MKALAATLVVGATLGAIAPTSSSASPGHAPPTMPAHEGEPARRFAEPAASKGRRVYAKRCAVCHGQSGKGDGPAAAGLEVQPPDFTSKEWQASVTDAQIREITVKGGPAVGKSASMPAAPDLAGKPELTELVRLVRHFGGR